MLNNKIKITIILSYMAAICFYISFIMKRETLYFVLGSAWLCIALSNTINGKKR